jgi:hypothetical protein
MGRGFCPIAENRIFAFPVPFLLFKGVAFCRFMFVDDFSFFRASFSVLDIILNRKRLGAGMGRRGFVAFR